LVVTRPSTTIFPAGTAQRLKGPGALVVVLEEVAVDLEIAEQGFGHGLVSALGGPHRLVVAPAQVRGDRQTLRPAGESPV
jgi:hypothetical protein